jgi:hypothetical protein
LVIPQFQTVRDGEGWVETAHNLKQCALAMHDYEEVHGHLPAANVTDKQGRILYSWRVSLLPFIEYDNMYKQFHLDEPWDSPHNFALLKEMPRTYHSMRERDRSDGKTQLHVFMGPGTAFEKDGLTRNDFPDGIANTILLVETDDVVPWSKPEDLVYDPEKPLPPFTSHPRAIHFLGWEVGMAHGYVFGFADGRARFINASTKEFEIRALITRNGAEKVDPSSLE